MTKTKRKKKLPSLRSINLGSGGHDTREKGMCAMEAAAYIAGEPHCAQPSCVCPVIRAFMIGWNDGLPNDAERNRLLKPLLPLILNTRAIAEIEKKRSFVALDWLIRTFTPAWLDLVPACKASAAALRGLAEICDDAAAIAARPTVLEAQKTAAAARAAARDAAGDAAWAAAWDAAGDAARAAAGAAAWDAARDAAWDAAGAAAWDAAGDAAWAAAGKVLEPTKVSLQQSAITVLKRIINIG